MSKAKNIINPSNENECIKSNDWPLLLKNYEKLNVRSNHFTPIPHGSAPYSRNITDYLDSGVIYLDKPANPSSHEVVSWVKRILGVNKTGHSGTLDPRVTGCLIICLGRATRLVKSQQNSGKEYVTIIRFHSEFNDEIQLKKVLEKLSGPCFQKPPAVAAVKRQLRVRSIYSIKLLEFDSKHHLALLHICCEAGTYIRTFCKHVGLLLGIGAHMQELRRVKSGIISESDGLITLHDLKDAMYIYQNSGDETYLRQIIHPLESLLTGYKRIIIKDSAINAVCYGAKLVLPGVLRYESGIELNECIVIVSTKGEAIALAIALMTTSTMAACDHGIVASIKRVIMQRDLYPRKWGLGPIASKKKLLVQEGLLKPYGAYTQDTPKDFQSQFVNMNVKNSSLQQQAIQNESQFVKSSNPFKRSKITKVSQSSSDDESFTIVKKAKPHTS